jgi:hypothetical protein
MKQFVTKVTALILLSLVISAAYRTTRYTTWQAILFSLGKNKTAIWAKRIFRQCSIIYANGCERVDRGFMGC